MPAEPTSPATTDASTSTSTTAPPQQLALYRRYRPDTFSEVIGQDHVTGPLGQAISSGRINHAFLFSGPRGCGKTTSARILARALNCEQGPTPTPCGQCQSCQDLANGGPGSLDVIEIDAASHGGVDDARDLRERAFYAPVASRFKIYIIDEAHMVTREGFNALLKLVEEPPDHLKFIFATTEPDKVLPTIRSRTHHYAFRLVAPRILSDHLKRICVSEGVQIDDAVLPLVVRAGAGSVRDALSVLDQLVSGADQNLVTLTYASSLLGYTDTALLDDVIDAFAAHSGARVFETLDRALDAGLDPRRFVTDLLERFRDLLIIAVSGADDVQLQALVPRAPDERERMAVQAKQFGPAELTRHAELLAAGLVEMRGATAPRLTLELVAARMLLPATDDTDRQLQVRLEQLERQVRNGAVAPAASAAPAHRPGPSPVGAPAPTAAPSEPAVEAAPPARPATAPVPAKAPPRADTTPPATVAAPAASSGPAAPVEAPSVGAANVDEVRRLWPQIIENVKGRRRSAWMVLSREGAGPLSVSGTRLAISLPDLGSVKGFTSAGYGEVLSSAIADVTGFALEVEAVAQGAPATAPAASPTTAVPSAPTTVADPAPAESASAPRARRVPVAERIAAAQAEAASDEHDLHSADDPALDSEDDALSGEELLAHMLDAKQIGEIQH
jgi:DNA polymerase-3 subunit gamma/tau